MFNQPSIDDFIKTLGSLLEINNLQYNSDLSSLAEFDSMAKINLSLLIEELFSFQISYQDLDQITVISELYEHCVSCSESSEGLK